MLQPCKARQAMALTLHGHRRHRCRQGACPSARRRGPHAQSCAPPRPAVMWACPARSRAWSAPPHSPSSGLLSPGAHQRLLPASTKGTVRQLMKSKLISDCLISTHPVWKLDLTPCRGATKSQATAHSHAAQAWLKHARAWAETDARHMHAMQRSTTCLHSLRLPKVSGARPLLQRTLPSSPASGPCGCPACARDRWR